MPNKPPTDRPINAKLSEWLKEIEDAERNDSARARPQSHRAAGLSGPAAGDGGAEPGLPKRGGGDGGRAARNGGDVRTDRGECRAGKTGTGSAKLNPRAAFIRDRPTAGRPGAPWL
jgi:hypothetical protein